MITNFEAITHELTAKELELIPILVKSFSTRKENCPIKSPDIIKGVNDYLVRNNRKIKMSGPRLRKCCNYIRANGLLPLIATSTGYYVSYDKEIVKEQIKSLRQRANSINRCADGLEKFVAC